MKPHSMCANGAWKFQEIHFLARAKDLRKERRIE